MRKIPTLYVRDPATNLRYLTRDVHPACHWVIAGEGTATYKWDGTAVKVDRLTRPWKRREVKEGRPIPDGFDQEGDPDPETGKRVGWVQAHRDDPADRWLWEAYDAARIGEGTYELVGPKIQGNPHGFQAHELVRHGTHPMDSVPTDYDQLAEFLGLAADVSWFSDSHGNALGGFEGIVWHHPDGRMAKIKAKDFPKP